MGMRMYDFLASSICILGKEGENSGTSYLNLIFYNAGGNNFRVISLQHFNIRFKFLCRKNKIYFLRLIGISELYIFRHHRDWKIDFGCPFSSTYP